MIGPGIARRVNSQRRDCAARGIEDDPILGDLARPLQVGIALDHIRNHAELTPSTLIKIVTHAKMFAGQGQPAPAQHDRV